MNFMNSANRVTGQPKGTAATPTLMLWVIIGVATTTLDASDGESDRGDKRPLIGFDHRTQGNSNSRPTPDRRQKQVAILSVRNVVVHCFRKPLP